MRRLHHHHHAVNTLLQLQICKNRDVLSMCVWTGLVALPSFMADDELRIKLASLHFQGWKSWGPCLCQAKCNRDLYSHEPQLQQRTSKQERFMNSYSNIYFGCMRPTCFDSKPPNKQQQPDFVGIMCENAKKFTGLLISYKTGGGNRFIWFSFLEVIKMMWQTVAPSF